MRYFSFKILAFCILLPPVLYIVSIQSLERYFNENYAVEIENIYLGDTRRLLDGSIRLQDLVNDNIDRFLQNKILTSYGLNLTVTVSTRKGRTLYPAPFQENPESALVEDPVRVAADNFKLMNEGLVIKLDAKVEHNELLSNVILAFYVILSLLVLYRHYRNSTNKLIQEEIEKRREINRLFQLERETSQRLQKLDRERDDLNSELHRLRISLDDEKHKAIKNEDELFDEIAALEEKLNQNLALQEEKEQEISSLKERLQQHDTEKQKSGKKKIKVSQSIRKRFNTLYKNITINERAVSGFAELNEDLKIKAEEVIHQLNQDPEQVVIKRKVFFGKRDKKTIKEVIFGYKGRLYFHNLKESGIEILAIGTKNTQAREMEFLNKL